MAVKLYKHQIDALRRMHNGCILCGGVGTGKSITSLAWIYLENGGSIGSITGGHFQPPLYASRKLYIITTARKRDTGEWADEIKPFERKLGEDSFIDSWNNLRKYEDVANADFIFDEQRVVGYGAWTKSFLKIVKKNRWILLSATPGDVWMDYAPVFIANGYYRNITDFRYQHVIYRARTNFPQVERYVDIPKLCQLRNKVLVEMAFERKTVRHNKDVWCDYDSFVYKFMGSERKNPETKKPFKNISELCAAWRKCVNTNPSRLEAVIDICMEHPKVIIFYNFDYELDILLNAKWPYETKVAQWNGHGHEPIPCADRWVYLVQYNAGAEGWNCISTDTIVFYSQTYSYRCLEQAMGRIDRLNTPFIDLYYYHLKSKAPIDVAITRALKNKKKFNETKFVSPMMKGMT